MEKTLWILNQPNYGGFFHLFDNGINGRIYIWKADEKGNMIEMILDKWMTNGEENEINLTIKNEKFIISPNGKEEILKFSDCDEEIKKKLILFIKNVIKK